MGITYKLESFEGPLDLLLHLIDLNKVSIYDIPIVMITDQYLEYIQALHEDDMEITSDFLVMAATLLRIKSQMLLPKEEDEPEEIRDLKQELIERLMELKMYKYIARELKDMSTEAAKTTFKETMIPEDMVYTEPPVNLDELVGNLNLDKLHKIFMEVMKRQADKIDPVRSRYGRIEREPVNLADKISSIRSYAKKHKRFSFRKLLEKQSYKEEVIVTFLAILELMKSGSIHVTQEALFDDMVIDVKEMADGEQTDGGGNRSAAVYDGTIA